MSNKYDQPPAYTGPQAPQPAYQGGSYPPQQGYPPQQQQGGYYQANPNMGYYQQPQQGPYPPQQGGAYYGQQGYYPQGQYQQRNSSPGCLEGLFAALACCCCLDLLF